MFKWIIAIVFATFCSTICFSQNSNSILWQITGKDLKSPSYILGVMHVMCKDEMIWTKKMENCLAACQSICFEIPINDSGFKHSILKMASIAKGKNLKSYFKEDEYRIVKQFLSDSLKIDSSKIIHLKPEFIYCLITARYPGCKNRISYAKFILSKSQGKSVQYLENASEQTDILSNNFSDTLNRQIISMIKESGEYKQYYDKLLSLFIKQDIDSLFEIVSLKSGKEGLNKYVINRNIKWIPLIEEKMRANPTFFALGAAHLASSEGLLALLCTHGYTVRAVKLAY